MTLTIVCIGDPHIQVSNIPEVEMFVDRLEKLCLEKQPVLICILGDILHTHERLHTTALNKAYDFIDRMRKIAPTYVLVGNHDMINNQNFLNDNHWLNGMKEWDNITIVDKVHSVIVNEEKLVFVPFVPPGRFMEALQTYDGEWDDASCIFAHQEFSGCKMGAITSVEGDKWLVTNPHVVSGHIHSRQIIQNNIYYPGSAMQHAFGESEKNIIAYLTINDKEYEREEIDLNLPRKKIIYKDVEDVEKYIPPDTDDKIKVTVSGNYEQFKALKKTKKYKDLLDNGVKVIFKPKKLERESQSTSTSENEETSFRTILHGIVNEQKDPYLTQAFEFVINDNEIGSNDVMFVNEE
jgi:DNA repair exonuclease SbcCD nuclease subunit